MKWSANLRSKEATASRFLFGGIAEPFWVAQFGTLHLPFELVLILHSCHRFCATFHCCHLTNTTTQWIPAEHLVSCCHCSDQPPHIQYHQPTRMSAISCSDLLLGTQHHDIRFFLLLPDQLFWQEGQSLLLNENSKELITALVCPEIVATQLWKFPFLKMCNKHNRNSSCRCTTEITYCGTSLSSHM